MQADSPTQPEGRDDSQDESAPQARPAPDGPGPRDVPDDQVIDKTLPAKPADDGGRPG